MYKCDVCTPPYSCFTKQDFQRHRRSKGHLLTVTRNMKLTQAQQIPTPQIQTLQIKVPQVMAMTQHGQTGHEQKIEQMEVLAQWTIDGLK